MLRLSSRTTQLLRKSTTLLQLQHRFTFEDSSSGSRYFSRFHNNNNNSNYAKKQQQKKKQQRRQQLSPLYSKISSSSDLFDISEEEAADLLAARSPQRQPFIPRIGDGTENYVAKWQSKGDFYISYDNLKSLNQQLMKYDSERSRQQKKSLLQDLKLTYFARCHNMLREEYQFERRLIEDRLRSWSQQRLQKEGFALFDLSATLRGNLYQDTVVRFYQPIGGRSSGSSGSSSSSSGGSSWSVLDFHRFGVGDSVRLSASKSRAGALSESAIDGVVLDRRQRYLDVCFSATAAATAIDTSSSKSYRLDCFVNRVAYDRMLESLHLFVQSGSSVATAIAGDSSGFISTAATTSTTTSTTTAAGDGGASVLRRQPTISPTLRDLILYSYPNAMLRLAQSPGGLKLALPALINNNSNSSNNNNSSSSSNHDISSNSTGITSGGSSSSTACSSKQQLQKLSQQQQQQDIVAVAVDEAKLQEQLSHRIDDRFRGNLPAAPKKQQKQQQQQQQQQQASNSHSSVAATTAVDGVRLLLEEQLTSATVAAAAAVAAVPSSLQEKIVTVAQQLQEANKKRTDPTAATTPAAVVSVTPTAAAADDIGSVSAKQLLAELNEQNKMQEQQWQQRLPTATTAVTTAADESINEHLLQQQQKKRLPFTPPVFQTNERLRALALLYDDISIDTILSDSSSSSSSDSSFSFPIADIQHAFRMLNVTLNVTGAAGPNRSQQQAMLAAIGRPLTLIQGPPGTGKTRTACGLLSLLVELKQLRLSAGGQRSRGIKSDKILACAHSNVAADNLLDGLLSLGLHAVRIGRPSSVRSSLWEATLDSRLQQNALWSQQRLKLDAAIAEYHAAKEVGGPVLGAAQRLLGSAKRRFEAIESKCIFAELKAADVVVSSCIGAGSDVLRAFCRHDGARFRTVLIDEAAQCTESAVLPSLQYGCERLVLIGDQNQLPPVVASPIALDDGLGVSMFARFIAAGLQPLLLNEQYRMHPAIAAFPSTHFYGGSLISRTAAADRPLPAGFDWPRSDVPVVFIDVSPFSEPFSDDDAATAVDATAATVFNITSDSGSSGSSDDDESSSGGTNKRRGGLEIDSEDAAVSPAAIRRRSIIQFLSSAASTATTAAAVESRAFPISGGFESISNTSQASYFNDAEADVVMRIIDGFLRSGDVSLSDIGVISPYNAQVRSFSDRFRARGWIDTTSNSNHNNDSDSNSFSSSGSSWPSNSVNSARTATTTSATTTTTAAATATSSLVAEGELSRGSLGGSAGDVTATGEFGEKMTPRYRRQLAERIKSEQLVKDFLRQQKFEEIRFASAATSDSSDSSSGGSDSGSSGSGSTADVVAVDADSSIEDTEAAAEFVALDDFNSTAAAATGFSIQEQQQQQQQQQQQGKLSSKAFQELRLSLLEKFNVDMLQDDNNDNNNNNNNNSSNIGSNIGSNNDNSSSLKQQQQLSSSAEITTAATAAVVPITARGKLKKLQRIKAEDSLDAEGQLAALLYSTKHLSIAEMFGNSNSSNNSNNNNNSNSSDDGLITTATASPKQQQQQAQQQQQQQLLQHQQYQQQQLEVRSVDGFQGREKRVIVFSAVRCNRQKRVGFLRDWRRLNVALTRAKSAVVVVGCSSTLRSDPHWRAFIDWCRSSGCYQRGEVADAAAVAEYQQGIEPSVREFL